MDLPYVNEYAHKYVGVQYTVKLSRKSLVIVLRCGMIAMKQSWMFQDYAAKSIIANIANDPERYACALRRATRLPIRVVDYWCGNDYIYERNLHLYRDDIKNLNSHLCENRIAENIRADYFRHLVLHWCWCVKTIGLYKDLRRMIGRIALQMLHEDALVLSD